jgi:hypothetical protein
LTVEHASAVPKAPRAAHARQRPDRPFPFALSVAASLALGALSLLAFPDGLGYDPYTWLIWGRELFHLNLVTAGAASSVKPLPMLVDALLAWTGGAAPDLWMIIARAGVVMAALLAYRLGSRLGGPVAGAIAAIGFLTSAGLIGYMVQAGMSEPLGAAFSLAAVEAHLSRRRWAALLLLLGASLVRIEVFVFMAVYALLALVRTSPHKGRTLAGVAAVLVAVPLAWFLPDLLSAGSLLRSASRATFESQGGPLVAHYPSLATFKEAAGLMIVPIALGYAAELVIGLWSLARDRTRIRPTLGIALLAAAWVILEAAMAQLQVATGAPRYLLTGVGLAAVVAGAFWSSAATWVGRSLASPPTRVVAAVAVYVVFVVWSAFGVAALVGKVQGGERVNRPLAKLSRLLPAAIERAGGRRHVLACGPVYTTDLQVPAVAWVLNVPVGHVLVVPGPAGTIFALGGARPPVAASVRPDYRWVGPRGAKAHGGWRIRTTCPPSGLR